jgi:hypothetical protein
MERDDAGCDHPSDPVWGVGISHIRLDDAEMKKPQSCANEKPQND